MLFGMPSLIETKSIDECVQLCKSLGLHFIELNMNLPAFQTDCIDVEKLVHIREQDGIFFTFHLDENLNVCDFNKSVSDAYLQTAMDTIEIAKQISSPVVNMHLSNGVHFTMPDRKVYLFDQYNSHYCSRLQLFREQCEHVIGNTAIKICIENAGGFAAFSQKGIELLLESKVFGLTFDIGHNFRAHGIDEPFMVKHKDRLVHMHLHDALNSRDHLPLGQGSIDIAQYLRLARQCGCSVVLETKTVEGLRETVSVLRQMTYASKKI